MATQMELERHVLTHLDAFLSGNMSGDEVSLWATEALASGAWQSELTEEALIALSNLDHGDERLDTAREDLEFYRDCILGNRSFTPAVVSKRKD